jgi:ribonuclease P protein component
MLPSAYRMRRSADFTAVVRAGQRAGTPTVVIHHRSGLRTDGPALVGLVVGRSVGNSVVRHRVSRRLRAQLAARLSTLPAGSGTVVRARPAAAPASSTQLGRDLDQGLGRVLTSGVRGGSATRSRAEARG